jgi:hypothetical protein
MNQRRPISDRPVRALGRLLQQPAMDTWYVVIDSNAEHHQSMRIKNLAFFIAAVAILIGTIRPVVAAGLSQIGIVGLK